MGNCIQVSSYESEENAKVVTYNGEVLEFQASTNAKKVTSGPYSGYNLVHRSRPFSPLPNTTKLDPGEVYYLVPDLAKVLSRKVSLEEQSCGRSQKIKIVVTREELELLLGSANKQFQISQDIVGLSSESLGFEEGSPKWRPSLSSIAEVRDF